VAGVEADERRALRRGGREERGKDDKQGGTAHGVIVPWSG
jgi:hypothetical protein